MKCLVADPNLNQIVVFETSKITSMVKKDYNNFNSYSILINFDNGKIHSFDYNSVEEREQEWQRIMRCWRSDETDAETGHLTAAVGGD